MKKKLGVHSVQKRKQRRKIRRKVEKMDDHHIDPFASMFMNDSSRSEPVKSELEDTVLDSSKFAAFELLSESNINKMLSACDETYHEIRNESDARIEYSNHEEYDDSKFQSSDETFMMDSSANEFLSPENSHIDTPTPAKVKRVRGRPRGAKTGTGPRCGIQRKAVVNELKTTQAKVLPKMKPNIHTLKIGKDEAEELKKLPSFCQPGVCFQIAPNLNKCKECLKYLRKKVTKRQGDEVECRFFQFRKLKYENDVLEVAGFLNPESDPAEVDRSIWMPIADKRFKVSYLNLLSAHAKSYIPQTMAAQDALFILTHVGEQLCPLLKKEKAYYEKYKSEDKPVIWKRLIE